MQRHATHFRLPVLNCFLALTVMGFAGNQAASLEVRNKFEPNTDQQSGAELHVQLIGISKIPETVILQLIAPDGSAQLTDAEKDGTVVLKTGASGIHTLKIAAGLASEIAHIDIPETGEVAVRFRFDTSGAVIEAIEIPPYLILDEIMVSAEKREKNIQEVPISVAVLSGDDLSTSRVESTFDLQNRIPGFFFTSNGVLGQPYIRGVGSDIISAGADSTVATFVDGVYQTRAWGAVQDFFDIERIEVLKGPQGTLFGRNASGGAINIFSKEPTSIPGFEGSLLLGQYEKRRFEGALNIPIVSDRIQVRISGLLSERDGFIRNSFQKTDLDDEDLQGLRGQIRILASDQVDVLVRLDHLRQRGSRALAAHVADPKEGNFGFVLGGVVPENPREITSNAETFAEVDSWGLSARVNWDATVALVTSLTAYRNSSFFVNLDLDMTNVSAITNTAGGESNTFSQEIQLTSPPGKRFEWLGGLYYLQEDAFQGLDINVFPIGVRDRPMADLELRSVAAYGQATWHFGERWRLTAGLRYTEDRRSEDFVETVNDRVVAGFSLDADWAAWTPKLGIDYRLDDNLMVYATATRGFKSGGFNTDVIQMEPFDPEFLWSYEAGVKAALWQEKMRLNASVFLYDYTDIQFQVLAPGSPFSFPQVRNAGSATVKGLDLDLFARPNSRLDANLSVTFLASVFDDLITLDPNDLLGDPDQSGNRLPKAPDVAASFGVQYRFPLSSKGDMKLRGEYSYQSEVYFNIFQDDAVRQDGYGLWNSRISYAPKEARWSVSFFGKNIADELYAQSIIRVDGSIGNLIFWAPPRTFGIQLEFRH